MGVRGGLVVRSEKGNSKIKRRREIWQSIMA